jgi:hypothetical protein
MSEVSPLGDGQAGGDQRLSAFGEVLDVGHLAVLDREEVVDAVGEREVFDGGQAGAVRVEDGVASAPISSISSISARASRSPANVCRVAARRASRS